MFLPNLSNSYCTVGYSTSPLISEGRWSWLSSLARLNGRIKPLKHFFFVKSEKQKHPSFLWISFEALSLVCFSWFTTRFTSMLWSQLYTFSFVGVLRLIYRGKRPGCVTSSASQSNRTDLGSAPPPPRPCNLIHCDWKGKTDPTSTLLLWDTSWIRTQALKTFFWFHNYFVFFFFKHPNDLTRAVCIFFPGLVSSSHVENRDIFFHPVIVNKTLVLRQKLRKHGLVSQNMVCLLAWTERGQIRLGIVLKKKRGMWKNHPPPPFKKTLT